MEIDMDQNQTKNNEKRPIFLVVLSVLSFITLGISALSLLFQVFRGPLSKEELLAQKVEMSKMITQMKAANIDFMVDILEKTILMSQSMNAHFYGGLIVTFISTLIGIFGVVKMLNGFKLGFHLYIIYSLLGIGQIYLFVSPAYVPEYILYTNLLFSGIFIFMYSRNLHWMK